MREQHCMATAQCKMINSGEASRQAGPEDSGSGSMAESEVDALEVEFEGNASC